MFYVLDTYFIRTKYTCVRIFTANNLVNFLDWIICNIYNMKPLILYVHTSKKSFSNLELGKIYKKIKKGIFSSHFSFCKNAKKCSFENTKRNIVFVSTTLLSTPEKILGIRHAGTGGLYPWPITNVEVCVIRGSGPMLSPAHTHSTQSYHTFQPKSFLTF